VAHARQRLQQRVALGCLGRDAEAAQHRRVAVAEGEVDDAPVVVAEGPEDPDRLREAVEQGAKAGRTLIAQERAELRVVSPAFRHSGSIGACWRSRSPGRRNLETFDP
jgi:hypothetical protein